MKTSPPMRRERHQPHSPLRQRDGAAIPARSIAVRIGSSARSGSSFSSPRKRSFSVKTFEASDV